MTTLALHQQRVVDEKIELDKKATALSTFIGASAIFTTLDAAEQAGDEVSVDIMVQRKTVHDKTAWMLRSTLA